MTHVILDETPAPGGPGGPAGPGAPAGGQAPRVPSAAPGTWHLTWHGVRTVTRLELRQRVRSTRWIVALVVWFVVVGAITLLVSGALGSLFGTSGGPEPADRGRVGPLLFSVVVFLVLGLGLLVTPTLSSTSVNGDRNAGTLATLQVTALSAAEIVVGKVLAAWLSSLAFLVTSTPFLLWALAAGRTPVVSFFLVLALVAVLLACVCGIGIGFSSLTARAAGSTVLTFLTVAALTLLTPLLFVVTIPSISANEQVRIWSYPSYADYDDDGSACQWQTVEQSVIHSERTWWLLGINPFVIVADGAGTGNGAADDPYGVNNGVDPLGGIRDGVRELRAGPATEVDYCQTWSSDGSSSGSSPVGPRDIDRSPVWPWGLGANILLGLGGTALAVRRLRVPQRTLAKGTRVA
ncbi:ABC transporter permease [Cellulomonas hominis]